MVCKQRSCCSNPVMNENTPDILKDYLAYCMRKSGYATWAPDFPRHSPTNHMKRLRILGQQYEDAFYRVFDNMISNFDLYAPGARENYGGVVSVVFDNGNGISWGRILGVIVFSSKLCIQAARDNRQDVVDTIYTWLCELFGSEQLSNWMLEHNGWDGFVEYYQHAEGLNHDNPDYWTRAWTMGVATIAGVAAVYNFFRS